MSVYRPPRYGLLGAHVSGVSAWVLVSILERAKALDSIQKMPAESRDEVLETYDALRAAGIYWNEQRRAFPALATAPPEESGETPGGPAEQISALDAARILGCSERWVRQLLAADRIAGRLVAGRWLVDAESLEDYVLAKDIA